MENFKYLVVILNEDNNNHIDFANKTYFMLQNFFKNKNTPKELKLRPKNTTINKTLTHASETGTLTETDRKQVNIFERKM